MNFDKKVILLKQLEKGFALSNKTASGIARIETENGVSEFFLSLINLKKPNFGEFFAFVLDACGKLFYFPLLDGPDFLAKTFPSLPSTNALSVGIIFAESNIPSTVLFGTTENSAEKLTDFKKSVAEHFSSKHREELESSCTRASQATQKIKNKELIEETSRSSPYDDEAVATENYYEFDEIERKLNLIMERDNEKLQPENELPNCRCKNQTQKVDEKSAGTENETNANPSAKRSEKAPYYLSIREELEKIFSAFPAEEDLIKLFSGSRWVKVFYSGDKYYTVGIIPENGKEKYVCYGVPANYSKEPPKELKGFCSFIPLSIFALEEKGYWMMFQDAVSGECIKPK